MVGVRSEADVFVHIQAQILGVQDFIFRNFAHVGVQDAIHALGPNGGKLAVGVLDDGFYVAFEHCVKLALNGEVVCDDGFKKVG